jgi:hypothetical protein
VHQNHSLDLRRVRCDSRSTKLAELAVAREPLLRFASLTLRRRYVNSSTKANDVVEPELAQVGVELVIAESSIGQDGDAHVLRNRLSQPQQQRVLVLVAPVLQRVRSHGLPEQGRGPTVLSDAVEHERRMAVGVEVGPIQGHQ